MLASNTTYNSFVKLFCSDIFYQDPQLFGSQACLDGIIEDIARLLQVPRWQLHVVGQTFVVLV